MLIHGDYCLRLRGRLSPFIVHSEFCDPWWGVELIYQYPDFAAPYPAKPVNLHPALVRS